jgi:high mobility group AT-hook protein 2
MKTEKLPQINESTLISLLERLGVPIKLNTEKRKRGRPRKNPLKEPVVEKRKRGRPRKNPDVIVEKRKRGRPRKNPDVIVEKRKRGRPRKNPDVIIEKKKRGRPSKFSVENLQKKGVGRPRKYDIDILTKPELKIVPVLISILEKSDKPVHTHKLVSQINTILNFENSKSFGEPTLRKVINYIRAKSLSPIVSINGTGYEISLSKNKIKAQIDSLNKRASSIISSAHGLKKFL